jgi:hypothetical protein
MKRQIITNNIYNSYLLYKILYILNNTMIIIISVGSISSKYHKQCPQFKSHYSTAKHNINFKFQKLPSINI